MNMKTGLFVVLSTGFFLVSTAASCSLGKRITGSKNYITKEVKPNPFNAIKLIGSMDVIYQQDSRYHIEIQGSDNIVALLETEVDGETLVIKFKKNANIQNKGKLEVKVFSPELNKLSINGSGDVKFANGIETPNDIELSINGSGDIQGNAFNCRRMITSINGSGDIKLQQIQSEECSASINGSGDIELSGKTIKANYQTSGSGDISASNLQATSVETKTSGSGDISCYASEKLTARTSGSGDISYKGNPQKVDSPRKGLHKLE